MADPPSPVKPTSPVSIVLRTLGMTREDLVVHTEQFRAHLYEDNPPEPDLLPTHKARSLRRSRTTPLPSLVSRIQTSSPPRTPVKSEPVEVSIPSEQMDAMHAVMESKERQNRRERKGSLSQMREIRRVSKDDGATPTRLAAPKLGPDTPHHYRYYSERVIGEASTSQLSMDANHIHAPQTPTRSHTASKIPSASARLPKTPVSRHLQVHGSSSRASTPCSSPIVNLVSSPGPMINHSPDDEEDELPYTLPPGPYSKEKPDFSYAALIGQAILSSPDHRLTLQDIYEWITTVYPYYTRGEQTWMNSVRHSLSTMAVFRKVPRGRNEGKSLWAILDCDLPCFENGGFRKNLCADMVKAKEAAKSGQKRKTIEETLAREPKRRKKNGAKDEAESSTKPPSLQPVYAAPFIPPFYASMYPTAQQQPYYANYITQALPAEVIFPPLPPQSAYHRLAASRAAAEESNPEISEATITDGTGHGESSQSYVPPAQGSSTPKSKGLPKAPSSSSSTSSSSSLSLPSFTPNCSSSSASSPPPSSEPSCASIDDGIANELMPSETTEAATDELPSVDSEDEVDRLTRQWLASPSSISAFSGSSPKVTPEKGSGKAKTYKPLSTSDIVDHQSPPSAMRANSSKASILKDSPNSDKDFPTTARDLRFVTPPRRPPPHTPPRKRTTSSSSIHLSAQKTPISHRGLHMSPSSSTALAHYKSHLDPPPPAIFKPAVHAPLLLGMTNDDPSLILPSPELSRTPSRKRNTPSTSGSGSHGRAPVTPRRLFSDESPEHGLRPLLDPHDPSALIDDEVLRLGSQPSSDSPEGFFSQRDLLYESPDIPSPARLERYW